MRLYRSYSLMQTKVGVENPPLRVDHVWTGKPGCFKHLFVCLPHGKSNSITISHQIPFTFIVEIPVSPANVHIPPHSTPPTFMSQIPLNLIDLVAQTIDVLLPLVG